MKEKLSRLHNDLTDLKDRFNKRLLENYKLYCDSSKKYFQFP